ncbi:hypothetical protein N9920_02010 [Akkermansiaceae bacterium]|nr:hypothetical protein [Akkermansiaceae bacterium]MDA7519671.1 hypothetical protein [bacterium]MDA7517328.1 hypothetical protein [Akkermansiaceae bacterium]MDB4272376.1 hypothetical protein [bacterium]MDB4286852.1 hypothetical protein [Akkermansiaceae bacterium]
MNLKLFRKHPPASPGPTPSGFRSRGALLGGGLMESKPKLKRLEFLVLSSTLLLLSLVTGGSLLGSYFFQFTEVPGSEWLLIVGILGFIFVHIFVLVPEWKHDCTLKFSKWSLGIVWGSLGVMSYLGIIGML